MNLKHVLANNEQTEADNNNGSAVNVNIRKSMMINFSISYMNNVKIRLN